MDTNERVTKLCNMVISIFLVITAIILLVTSTLLVTHFFVTKWGDWDDNMVLGPYLMIALSIFQLFISINGFINSVKEKQCYLTSFAIFLSIAFIAQIGAIVICININVEIKNDGYLYRVKSSAESEIQRYVNDTTVQKSWDNLQAKLDCCGVVGKQNGYKIWLSPSFDDMPGLPNSCCRDDSPDCGEYIDKKDISANNIGNKIYTEGCLNKLERKMNDIVRPLIMMCALIGGGNAMAELICIVLVSVYVIQMSQRGKRAVEKIKVIDSIRKGSKAFVDELIPMKLGIEKNDNDC